ncbi:MAG: hypothetical protein UV61_C0032G0006 [Candidatus Gottesmanbacteria bacterium GW2011_GWB1_43_11]|uniref:Zinc/iron permease n=1 Tax=Candidatus Gottesmanbacteria bacterium GW2011_GWB1_43_11 TaxID=1618446 RepID=A0A0G1CEV8_9BACT|nr:MAG: hypothetical protein UV17_C0043G0004 [Candidatus Gottesmanbacteria bacterium GW2011_GWA1_42_26]KKS84330.1 MAG: hypothetical protein UV61_C0032G0006 [Candidatus Gottesmanbacteria bacterium GW2011_GWB1_43_11]OGG09248.1 MAG: hypothetical protein A2699_06235 [Candidatus Gottesmanbacteria bacterium RIFCSPHIGHO2_01_FULL_43_15]
MLWQIVLLTFSSGVLSLGGGLFLIFRKRWNESFVLKLTSFAAGVLLSTAFLDLLPEANIHIQESGKGDVFLPTLGGMILFFLLERSLLWYHHHHTAHDIKPTIWMVTFGDGFHNLIDGVAISTSFLLNPALGVTTAIAIAAHEIPQEIADFGILLSGGLTKWRAIAFNLVTTLTALIGAIITYYFAPQIRPFLGVLTAFTAGMFSYIALSDLIPELHRTKGQKDTVPQVVAFLLGIIMIGVFKSLTGV